MLPAFLITFRETLEASLIVAAILSILIKFKQTMVAKSVWLASGLAAFASIAILIIASFFGLRIQEIYTGKTEEFIEGIFMIASAGFITWAVFFLHKTFTDFKKGVFKKISEKAEKQEIKGIFWLTFIAVFREGFEIVLFLSTIFLSSRPMEVFSGFITGVASGLVVALSLVITSIRLPIKAAFKSINLLLIFFASGLLARGIHEFEEAKVLPQLPGLNFVFLPEKGIAADLIKALFGLTPQMNYLQISLYLIYTGALLWFVFIKKDEIKPAKKSL